MSIPPLAPLRESVLDARLAYENALRRQSYLVGRRDDIIRVLPNARTPEEAAQLTAELNQIQATDLPAADAAVGNTDVALTAAKKDYDDACAAEPALWGEDGDLPVLMLPVRLETVFRTGEAGPELWIRVYPDDIHVDSHEPELTSREIAEGQCYWRRVWAAGVGDGDSAGRRRDQAWRDLVAATSRPRASWVAQRTRPAAQPPTDETSAEAPWPDPSPFPEPGTRDSAWTRAAHTTLLPERFEFTAYRRGQVVWRVRGGPIPDTLPVSFAPPGADAPPSADGLPWDDASRWLVNFDEAVKVGMGIKVPLDAEGVKIDVLTAVGVLSNIDAATGASRIETMLTAHRYTDGLGILPAGTPTNNTPKTRSLWRSLTDPTDPLEHERRRADYDPASGQPAARLARALGIDGRAELITLTNGGFDDDDGVKLVQDLVSRMMLWSRSWLAKGDNVLFLKSGLQYIADHSREFVRNRGPLPVLRIGRQPYGVLPATSMDLWRDGDVDARIVRVVQSFQAFAHEHRDIVAQLGGENSDSIFLDIMSRMPSSDKVWQLDQGAGLAEQPPGLIGAIPGTSQIGDRPYPVRPERPHTISDPAPPELQAIALQKPMTRARDAIIAIKTHYENWDWTQPGDPPRPDLTSAVEASNALTPLMQAEAVGVFYPFLAPIVSISLFCASVIALTAYKPDDPDTMQRAKDAIDELIAMSSDAVSIEDAAAENLGRLERLFTESLDTMSHRLDTWVTSLATARLTNARANGATGLRVGAYGWLTDLTPVDPAQRAARDGYIVSPSMQHATTAAVLRSGYLAHGGAERQTFAVNLTSRRVRRANALLEGIRSGQTLSALLGYQFERALHDASLDVYIADFRSKYPLAPQVDPTAEQATEAEQAIAARSVTDGNALREDRAALEAGAGRVTTFRSDRERASILAIVVDLDNTVDALGDLLLAESVHHLVGGNALRAGATVDAIAGGDWLPQELEVIATPRSGSLLTFSVGDLVPSGAAVAGWDPTRRIARLSPELELLCQKWLGAAAGWTFELVTPVGVASKTLADLGICAIEALLDSVEHSAPEALDAGGGVATASPILRALLRATPGATGLVDGETGTGRFAELAALAGQWRTRLADSSPLLLANIAPAHGSGWELVNLDDASLQLATWYATLGDARDALTTAKAGVVAAVDDAARDAAIAQVIAALDSLAEHGVRGSRSSGQPADDAARTTLLAQADAVLDHLGAAVPQALPPVPADRTATSIQSWFAVAIDMVRAVVGDAITLLPVLDLGEMVAVLHEDHRPSGADNSLVEDWLREVGRVRPATDDLNTARLASEVLAACPAPNYIVSQAPGDSVQPWIAHAAVGDGGITSPRVSCILSGDAPASTKVSGIVFDAWTEVLPGRPRETDVPGEKLTPEEVAAASFHFDRPDARAPQAALLAVPPDPSRHWRSEDLHTVVIETFEMTRIRSLDLNDIPQLRAVVPLPYMDLR